MAEFRIAICLVWLSSCVFSNAFGQEPAPVAKLSQPINYKQCECDCAGCIRDKACLRQDEVGVPGDEDSVAETQLADDWDVELLAGLGITKETLDGSGVTPVKQVAFQSLCDAGQCCSGTLGSSTCDSADCSASSCDSANGCCSAPCVNGSNDDAGCQATSCDSAGSCDSGGDACSSGGVCGALKLGDCIDEHVDWSCLNLCCQEGFWLRSESLLWWTSEDSIPVLATSSPLGTPIDDAGVLGLSSTSDIFSDPLFGDARRGGRLRFGWWATQCKHGLEGSVWGLLNESDQNAWESEGDPSLARPFFNVDPLVNAPDSQLIAHDGVVRGRLRINTSSEIFGADIGLRKNICCCANVCGSTSTRLDCYAGFRYFKVREGVRVLENLESTSLVGPTALGTTIDLYDDFQTRNEFNGGTIGFVVAQQYRRLTAEMTARLSLGNLSREVTIDGATTVTVPTLPPVTTAGGLLTQPTNIGTYRNDDFAVLPEIQFNFLYNLTCNKRLVFGYTFMYLGDLVRPGDVIDPTLNGLLLDPTLPVTGPERPSFAYSDSRTWLMGLSLGFQMDF